MAYGIGYPNPNYPQMYTPQYQQPNNGNGIIWVQGEAGMKSYLVAPNTTVQLWDTESQTIYLKSADASGMPSIKVLDYVVREQSQSDNNSKSEYVTKADLEAFGDRIIKQIGNNNFKRRHDNNKDEEKVNG